MMKYNMRKGAAVLLCAALLLGAAACKSEGAGGKKPETSGTAEEAQQGGEKGGNGEISPITVTQTPVVSEAIAAVKENLARESAKRTAVVKLSDAGIEISGSGCEADGSQLKIKEAGVYEISGMLSNGSIYVNVDNESEVHLIFNGVTIHNETSAALYCKKASKVTITLAEGSVNTFSDGASYVFEEGEDEPDATLYAKHDLVISGTGKLVVTSAYGDAVKGKDSLYILGGTFEVTSAEDGIVGRDLLYIADGTFTVNAVEDALKASNDTDADLGNISIDGGCFAFTSGEDGIQAENTLTITGGEFGISSGDDGIHAEETLQVGGKSKIRITKSCEGLEALNIIIDGGEIAITASDDGLNAAGGADGSGFGRRGMDMFKEGEGEVTINGGEITVNAEGDGVDSNGNLTMNGGTVLVIGPEGGGNGVLDYGGSFALNGGSLLATGSSDMAQTPSDTSGQYSLAAVLPSRAQAGSVVEIVIDGKTQFSQEVPKPFNYIVASSEEFKKDADIAIAVNGENCYEGTLTDTVTCFGFTGGMGGFGRPDGFGGGGKGEFDGHGGKDGFGDGMRPEMPNGERPQMPEGGWLGFPEGEMPQMPEDGWTTFPWNAEQSEMSD